MRRGSKLLTMLAGLAALTAAAAVAEPLVLPNGAILRAGPSKKAPVLATIPEGATVEAIDHKRYWTIVSWGAYQGYLDRNAIIRKGAYLSPPEVYALENPNCDVGYPYSGSSRYFYNLTELRHTGPLGALLGEHVYRPC